MSDCTYTTSGSLPIELVGGPTANYLDVACDGSVTGQGMDRISGTVMKDPLINGSTCSRRGFGNGTGGMDWNVTIDRTFTITGIVEPGDVGDGGNQVFLQTSITASLEARGHSAQPCLGASASES